MSKSTNSHPGRHWPRVAILILLLAVVLLTVVYLQEIWKPQLPPFAALDRSAACSETYWIGILKQPEPREPQRQEGEPLQRRQEILEGKRIPPPPSVSLWLFLSPHFSRVACCGGA